MVVYIISLIIAIYIFIFIVLAPKEDTESKDNFRRIISNQNQELARKQYTLDVQKREIEDLEKEIINLRNEISRSNKDKFPKSD